MPETYTISQLAAEFDVTTRTIRNKISEGLITGYRFRGIRAVRVDLDEIERMAEVIPAVTKPKKPMYGENAKIVYVAEAADAEKVG